MATEPADDRGNGLIEAVDTAMRGVVDPELQLDVVTLGMYRGAEVDGAGEVTVRVALTTAGCPLRAQIANDVKSRIRGLPGVTDVRVVTSEMSAEDKKRLMAVARKRAQENPAVTEIPARTRVLAISSGKGGVGKSSVTVNLSAALAARRFTVGLLDADIAGFSVPRMLGVAGPLAVAESDGQGGTRRKLIQPVEKTIGAGRIRAVSMGFLSPEGEAIMWRGQMLNRGVQHFLEDVAWGDLDYLVVDMPPGTGDVQMGLARMLPRAEMILVTTPALAAQKVASRAADMARKGYLRVVGVVENMSGFVCGHGQRYDLFGSGGGGALAAEIGAPLLATIPIEPAVSAGGDAGAPASLGEGPAAQAFAALVDAVLEVAPVLRIEDCTARLLRRLDGLD